MAGITTSDAAVFLQASTLTIATGVVTVTQRRHIVAAETGTTDDLVTITPNFDYSDATMAEEIVIQSDSTDTITVKHGTGNIQTHDGGDISLAPDKLVALYWDVINSVWRNSA